MTTVFIFFTVFNFHNLQTGKMATIIIYLILTNKAFLTFIGVTDIQAGRQTDRQTYRQTDR